MGVEGGGVEGGGGGGGCEGEGGEEGEERVERWEHGSVVFGLGLRGRRSLWC